MRLGLKVEKTQPLLLNPTQHIEFQLGSSLDKIYFFNKVSDFILGLIFLMILHNHLL